MPNLSSLRHYISYSLMEIISHFLRIHPVTPFQKPLSFPGPKGLCIIQFYLSTALAGCGCRCGCGCGCGHAGVGIHPLCGGETTGARGMKNGSSISSLCSNFILFFHFSSTPVIPTRRSLDPATPTFAITEILPTRYAASGKNNNETDSAVLSIFWHSIIASEMNETVASII